MEEQRGEPFLAPKAYESPEAFGASLVNVVNWRKLLKGVMDRSSVLFLILFMANAFRGRFLALFYEAHNLNDAQIGYILSVSSLVSALCALCLRLLCTVSLRKGSETLTSPKCVRTFHRSAAKSKVLRTDLRVVTVLPVATKGPMTSAAELEQTDECSWPSGVLVSLACSPLASKIADKYDSRALVTMVTYSFGIAVFLMQLIALPDIHVGLSQKGRFATLFVMRVFQAGFASPVYPLVCAMCIAALRKEFGPDGHTKFGQKRLWGAVGWAFSSLLLGFLLDQDGIGVWIVHVGYSVFGCLFLAVVYLSSGDERKRKVKRTSSWELIFPDHVEAGSDKAVEGGISATAVAKDINQQQQEISYVAVLHNLFSGDSIPEDSTMSVSAGMQSRARIMMFLVIQFTLAAVMSLVENLLFLFFKDDLRTWPPQPRSYHKQQSDLMALLPNRRKLYRLRPERRRHRHLRDSSLRVRTKASEADWRREPPDDRHHVFCSVSPARLSKWRVGAMSC
eukprot:scaffold1188_cov255-Pinguiococcus_pyrenoidosus.AAC.14